MSVSSSWAWHLNTPPQAQLQLHLSKHVAKSAMLLSSQDLGEDVNNLILCVDINKINLTCQDLLPDEMIMNFNVFRPHMKHWVPSQLNTAKVITIYDNLSIHMQPQISK
jgi:hypothetical protein